MIEKSRLPNKKCPSAAAPTSGTACTRSVPTISFEERRGYMIISVTMISDPDPTDVMPTIRPPSAPTAKVGSGRTSAGSIISVTGASLRRACRRSLARIAPAATIRTQPSTCFTVCSFWVPMTSSSR